VDTRLLAVALSLLAGCAPGAGRPASDADDSDARASVSPELEAELTRTRAAEQARETTSRRLSTPAASRWRVTSISEPERRLPPVGRRARVDVHFHDAELEEALRLLADAGGFAMVAEGELSGRVTLELRRVPPYEALVIIAEAHGARVTRQGRIVVVTPAAAH
jgi:type II secretory pathway component HofQ